MKTENDTVVAKRAAKAGRSAHPPPQFEEKSASHSDLSAFRFCQLKYLFSKLRRRRAPRQLEQVVGDVTHDCAAVDDQASREELLNRRLERVPEDQREEAETIVRQLLEVVDEFEDDEEVVDRKKEKLIRWLDDDPEKGTGWELVAKPDEYGLTTDEDSGREVFQIVDNKTAERIKHYHKDQVFFFGLVAALANSEWSGSIKLVVRLLRSNTKKVFWFSRNRIEEDLDRARETIREMQTAIETDTFTANTGEHCHKCPFREGCDAFKAWSEQGVALVTTNGVKRLTDSTPEDPARHRSTKRRRKGRGFYLSRHKTG